MANNKKRPRIKLNEFGLTELEEAFCHQYPIDLCGTDAYLRVKPAVKRSTAQVESSKLLSNPMLQDRIAALNKELLARVDITADRVLQEIGRIAFQNIADYGTWDAEGNLTIFPSSELPRYLQSVIKKIRTNTTTLPGKGEDAEPIVITKLELELASKTKGLEMLGRHLDLFKETNGPAVIVNFHIEDAKKQKPGG